jgi:hypothetical protein
MSSLKDIVVDCKHPASIARFWAMALDEYTVAPYDEAELTRLRKMGVDDPEDDPTVLLVRYDGGTPRIFFQQVPEAKQLKNRVHLDLDSADADATAASLVAQGATIVASQPHLITLCDPEGNEFCVLRQKPLGDDVAS